MSARRLIVNADDLGRSAAINDGIFEAHRRGIVTSATLMVTWDAAEDAAHRLAQHPALGVGLHVTLTDSVPISPVPQVSSLLIAGGSRFPRTPEEMVAPSPVEVAVEVRAQVARFQALVGRPPSHLDSHHHSHRHPEVLEGLLAVALEDGLPVRRASEAVAARASALGVAVTDAFEARFYDEGVGVDRLLGYLDGVRPGVTELMCHPGRVDEALRSTSRYADQREAELTVLCDPGIARGLAKRSIELVHFGIYGGPT